MDISTLAIAIGYIKKRIEEAKKEGFKIQVELNRSILEEEGEEKIFYFLPKNTAKPKDGYDEYIYVNENWEQVGSTDIDLSSYALKTEVPTKTSQLQNDSDFLAEEQAYTLQKGIIYPLPPKDGIAHNRTNDTSQTNTRLLFFGEVTSVGSADEDLGLPKLTPDDYDTVFHFEITYIDEVNLTASGIRFEEVNSESQVTELSNLRHNPVANVPYKFDYSMSSSDVKIFRMRMYESSGLQKVKVKITRSKVPSEYTYSKEEIENKLDTKADNANTLSGYGIEDAYTKTAINTLFKTIPLYLEDEIERVKTAVLTAANYNDVVFGLYTDIHFGNADEAPTSLAQKWNGIRSLRKLADENILDFIIQGGDLLSQGLYNYDTQVLNQSQTEFSGCRAPLYTSKGDHDSNQTDTKISKSDFVKRTAPYMPKAIRSSAYPNNYYFDLPEKKTRVINIDTGTVMAGQSSYGEDYKTWSNEVLYDWLLDEVFTDEVKNGWRFIIFSHAPCDYEWQFGNTKRYRNAHPTDTTSSQNAAKGNMLLINDLMTAINNASTFSTEKTTQRYELVHDNSGVLQEANLTSKDLGGDVYGITGLYQQTAGYPQYIRTKDFSDWTSKAKVILSGHCHCDRLNTTTLVPDGDNYVRGTTSYAIGYTGSAARTGYKDEQNYYYPCFGTDGEIASWGHIETADRELGTASEQLFDIWIVGNTYVKRVRFGAGANSPLLSTTVTLSGSSDSDNINYHEQQLDYLAERTIDMLSKSYTYIAEVNLTDPNLFDSAGRLSHFNFSDLTYKTLIDNFNNIRLKIHIPDNPNIGEIIIEVKLLNYMAGAGGGSIPENTQICALVKLSTVPDLNGFIGIYYANYQKSNENSNVSFTLNAVINETSV